MKRMKNTNKVYQNIRRFYLTDFIFPILFLMILAAAWKYNPFRGIYTPMQIDSVQTLKHAYSSDNRYVKISLKDLHNTGYDYIRFGKVYGTYYYTFFGRHLSHRHPLARYGSGPVCAHHRAQHPGQNRSPEPESQRAA